MRDNSSWKARLFRSKAPVYLQSTVSECGLACLGMIAASFGNQTQLRELRIRHPVAMTGMSITQLVSAAKSMGLSSRALRLELEELKQLRLPAVLHWDLDHYVVLTMCGRNKITFIDPAIGKRSMTYAEVSKHFTGVGLEIWPSANFKKTAKPPRIGIASLWSSLSGLGPALLKILGLSFILQTAGLLLPLQSQLLIDQAIGRDDANFLQMLIIGFAAMQIFSAIGTYLRNYLSLRLSQSLAMGLHGNVIEHLLRLPLSFFQNRHIGDILSKLEAMGSVQGFIQAKTIGLLVDGVMAVVTFALLMAYGSTLTFLVIGSILVSNVIEFALLRFRMSLSHETLLAAARQNTLLIEMIRGIQPLRLFDKTTERFTVWQNAYAEELATESRSSSVNFLAGFVEEIIHIGFNALITYTVVSQVMTGHFTIGMMTSILAYSSYFSTAINGLISFFINYRMLDVPLERLADITQAPAESAEGQQLKSIRGAIEFKDVWFRYHHDLPWVLEGVNFKIKAGEHVAISGVSGAGKSTLLNLLLRSCEPERGDIFIDEVSLRTLAVGQYRSRLGTVTQNDELFSGTIAENICLFDSKPDMAWIEKVSAMAMLSEDIAKMPMAYSTLIGDMGSILSGGQKQRLLLARALYSKPSMLLVDEATSHLDAANEVAVNESINKLAITRLTIAHRQETLDSADRVLRLQAGKIVSELVSSGAKNKR
jgi:ATP-binding cassette, subfamily B, bacterial CvaB/MchF/RaxB